MELVDNNIAKLHGGISMFAGVGERIARRQRSLQRNDRGRVIKVKKDEKGHPVIGENGLPIIEPGSRIGLVYGH